MLRVLQLSLVPVVQLQQRSWRLTTFLLDNNFDDKEDRLRLEFKASDRHSRGELHSSQI